MSASIQVGAAVNSDEVLSQNLLASPDLAARGLEVIQARGARSATAAIAQILGHATAPVVMIPHQDVYLPAGTIDRLERAIEQAAQTNPDWALLGIVGVDESGRVRGRTWSSGLQKEVGQAEDAPVPAVSLDEVLLVIRRDAAEFIDPDLPGFHLYGTDLVLNARRAGRPSFVVDLPVVHNSVRVRTLDAGYRGAYRYMQRKWRADLPLPTCVVPVLRTTWRLTKFRARLAIREWRRSDPAVRDPDPAAIARRLGYEG